MISLTDIETLHALKGISLNVLEGEIVAILGKPGAGKNTLIRCINLLERPLKGQVIVEESDLTALDAAELRLARSKIGMVFEHSHLLSSRTVFQNVSLPLEIKGDSKKHIQEQVPIVLKQTGLLEFQDRYPAQLNAGQKQRVAIARALVNHPKILLCEEVTAGLEPKTAQSILQLLQNIQKLYNLTLVMVTHDLEVVKSICHRVIILEQGKIVETSSLLDLYFNPTSKAGKDFIKIAARLDMPSALRKRLRAQPPENSNPIWRVSFLGIQEQEPIIAHVIQIFSLSVSITQAHLEQLPQGNIGIMIMEVMAEAHNIENAIQFLQEKNIHVEVLGYAPRLA
jgi:D-methionine transport system ATP-binding protein